MCAEKFYNVYKRLDEIVDNRCIQKCDESTIITKLLFLLEMFCLFIAFIILCVFMCVDMLKEKYSKYYGDKK